MHVYTCVIFRLRNRETHLAKPGAVWNNVRRFYQCIIPNFTVVGVDKPPFFLRKFSPDGQHFIVFSADQTSVEVYEFKGKRPNFQFFVFLRIYLLKPNYHFCEHWHQLNLPSLRTSLLLM